MTRRSKKSSENVPLPGVSAGESLVDLLTLRGFRLHAGAGTERIYERLDKDGVGFFAFVTADSPPWLIVGALLEVDIQPDGIVGPALVAQILHEDFGLVKAMLRPELQSLALQVPLPLLAPNLMEPYLGRALEQIEAAARLTLAAVQDAKPMPHEKAAKTRAVAKARTAAARASGATPAESRSHAEVTTYRLKITLRGSKPADLATHPRSELNDAAEASPRTAHRSRRRYAAQPRVRASRLGAGPSPISVTGIRCGAQRRHRRHHSQTKLTLEAGWAKGAAKL